MKHSVEVAKLRRELPDILEDTGSNDALEFVERTGLSGWDFSTGSFTKDNTIRSLDISSIVPTDAVRIVMRVYASSSGTGRAFTFGGPDVTTVYDVVGVNTQVSSIVIEGQIEVPVDATQTIKYYADSTLSTADIAILGYWKPAS